MKRKKQKPKEVAARRENLTRRDFLKGASVAVSGGLLITEAQAAASPPGPEAVAGPGPVPITLKVNGKPHKLNLEPRVTLLEALRIHLDLTGAKRVCDRGVWGLHGHYGWQTGLCVQPARYTGGGTRYRDGRRTFAR